MLPAHKTPEKTYLSTIQVAKAVGVSVTTIKRWVDEGILPAHRTAGGHRKLILSDVLRISQKCGLPQANLTELALPTQEGELDIGVVREQLLESTRKVDLDRIRNILHKSHESGLSIQCLADEAVAPCLHMVGEQWRHGRFDISQEHLVTQTFVGVFYELRARVMSTLAKDRPVALGGAPEHDHYVLPSLLAKLTLIECGWNAINVGANTPTSAFLQAMDSLQPRLIWLSVSHIENTERFELEYHHLYRAALARGIPVSIGGRAMSNELRSRLPYTTFGDRFGQLAAFAQTLNPAPCRPKRGRPKNQE
jgi:MerR family transcriptional regulator, light-induced transcriptional regulator